MKSVFVTLHSLRHFYYHSKGQSSPNQGQIFTLRGPHILPEWSKCYFNFLWVYLFGSDLSPCQTFEFFPGILTTCLALSFRISVHMVTVFLIWGAACLSCAMLLFPSRDLWLWSNLEQVPLWSFKSCSGSLDSYLACWTLAHIGA